MVADHGGRIVKTTGDGLLLTFRLLVSGVEFLAKRLAGRVLDGPGVHTKILLSIRVAKGDDLPVADIAAKNIRSLSRNPPSPLVNISSALAPAIPRKPKDLPTGNGEPIKAIVSPGMPLRRASSLRSRVACANIFARSCRVVTLEGSNNQQREEEKQLQQELLVADLNLRRKQDFWETPRNIAILLGATAALFSAMAGWLGFKIGSTPSPPPVVIYLTPQGQTVPRAPAGAAKMTDIPDNVDNGWIARHLVEFRNADRTNQRFAPGHGCSSASDADG